MADFAARVVRGDQVVHARLRLERVPALGRALAELGLAGRDHEHARVDVGLQDVHRAVEVERRVAVVERAREQLDVERTLRAVEHAEARQERCRLQFADRDRVERREVVDVRCVHEQAVVRDDDDAQLLRVLEHVREGRSVDRGDDERVDALRQHVLDLRDLRVNVVLGVLQVALVAQRLEAGLQVVAVVNPAFAGPRGHRDADPAGLRDRRGTHRQQEDHQKCKSLFHRCSPSPFSISTGRAGEFQRVRVCSSCMSRSAYAAAPRSAAFSSSSGSTSFGT
ncbi:MAG: hypothetical protein BWY81_00248 [Firmicutes bacterium ADurb.Bin467]|nr:MAG: hypothetical protein BWY81_00248 [Firmicutes bacterium ADurb.Bin467]